MKKIFYYNDELTDDFGTSVKKIKPLPEDYVYASKNPFFRAFSFVLYRMVARPVAWIYIKVRFHHRFVGRSAARKIKTGYFIFANHITLAGDAFIPNTVSFLKRNYIITGEQANSLTALLPVMKAVGAIPLTDSVSANVKMVRCVKQRIAEGASVTVYPEAHVWPYYTGIRPYSATSFHYAVMTGAPVLCMTTCVQKRKFGKKPKLVTFTDGPFYPDETLRPSQAAEALREKVFSAMKARAKEHSTYLYYDYRKKEPAEQVCSGQK